VRVSVAIVVYFLVQSHFDDLEDVVYLVFVALLVGENLYLAQPDDVDPFLAFGLDQVLLGSEEDVGELEGDCVLEVLAPPAEEEDGGLDD
jgi:hypothetical protein